MFGVTCGALHLHDLAFAFLFTFHHDAVNEFGWHGVVTPEPSEVVGKCVHGRLDRPLLFVFL